MAIRYIIQNYEQVLFALRSVCNQLQKNPKTSAGLEIFARADGISTTCVSFLMKGGGVSDSTELWHLNMCLRSETTAQCSSSPFTPLYPPPSLLAVSTPCCDGSN